MIQNSLICYEIQRYFATFLHINHHLGQMLIPPVQITIFCAFVVEKNKAINFVNIFERLVC